MDIKLDHQDLSQRPVQTYGDVQNALKWLGLGSDAVAAFAGYVTDTGAAGTPFPSGWTVAQGATGRYTVTHNLGNTSYVPLITPDNTLTAYVPSRSSNSFDVYLVDPSTHSFTDGNFYFTVIPQ